MILSGQSKNFFLLIDLLGLFLLLVFFAIQGTGRVQAESMGKTLLVANTSVAELAKKASIFSFLIKGSEVKG